MFFTQLKNKIVKTRKLHSCTWCGEAIDVGSLVKHRVNVDEEGLWSEYWHDECWAAMLKVPYDELEDGFTPGNYPRGGTEYQG